MQRLLLVGSCYQQYLRWRTTITPRTLSVAQPSLMAQTLMAAIADQSQTSAGVASTTDITAQVISSVDLAPVLVHTRAASPIELNQQIVEEP